MGVFLGGNLNVSGIKPLPSDLRAEWFRIVNVAVTNFLGIPKAGVHPKWIWQDHKSKLTEKMYSAFTLHLAKLKKVKQRGAKHLILRGPTKFNLNRRNPTHPSRLLSFGTPLSWAYIVRLLKKKSDLLSVPTLKWTFLLPAQLRYGYSDRC